LELKIEFADESKITQSRQQRFADSSRRPSLPTAEDRFLQNAFGSSSPEYAAYRPRRRFADGNPIARRSQFHRSRRR
jgi:hypothetical protein